MRGAANFQHWNPALRGSYCKGLAAYWAGQTPADCPYQDKRKANNRLTWSRSFIAAWHDGFNDAQRYARIEKKLTAAYLEIRKITGHQTAIYDREVWQDAQKPL